MMSGVIDEILPSAGGVRLHVRGHQANHGQRMGVEVQARYQTGGDGDIDFRPGDELWWKGRFAYWTPAHRMVANVKLVLTGPAYKLPDQPVAERLVS